MITDWFAKKSLHGNPGQPGTASGYRIGDRVQSDLHGAGRVRAVQPDGSVIVRFDGRKNSRVIYPSLLVRSK